MSSLTYNSNKSGSTWVSSLSWSDVSNYLYSLLLNILFDEIYVKEEYFNNINGIPLHNQLYTQLFYHCFKMGYGHFYFQSLESNNAEEVLSFYWSAVYLVYIPLNFLTILKVTLSLHYFYRGETTTNELMLNQVLLYFCFTFLFGVNLVYDVKLPFLNVTIILAYQLFFVEAFASKWSRIFNLGLILYLNIMLYEKMILYFDTIDPDYSSSVNQFDQKIYLVLTYVIYILHRSYQNKYSNDLTIFYSHLNQLHKESSHDLRNYLTSSLSKIRLLKPKTDSDSEEIESLLLDVNYAYYNTSYVYFYNLLVHNEWFIKNETFQVSELTAYILNLQEYLKQLDLSKIVFECKELASNDESYYGDYRLICSLLTYLLFRMPKNGYDFYFLELSFSAAAVTISFKFLEVSANLSEFTTLNTLLSNIQVTQYPFGFELRVGMPDQCMVDNLDMFDLDLHDEHLLKLNNNIIGNLDKEREQIQEQAHENNEQFNAYPDDASYSYSYYSNDNLNLKKMSDPKLKQDNINKIQFTLSRSKLNNSSLSQREYQQTNSKHNPRFSYRKEYKSNSVISLQQQNHNRFRTNIESISNRSIEICCKDNFNFSQNIKDKSALEFVENEKDCIMSNYSNPYNNLFTISYLKERQDDDLSPMLSVFAKVNYINSLEQIEYLPEVTNNIENKNATKYIFISYYNQLKKAPLLISKYGNAWKEQGYSIIGVLQGEDRHAYRELKISGVHHVILLPIKMRELKILLFKPKEYDSISKNKNDINKKEIPEYLYLPKQNESIDLKEIKNNWE